MSQWPATCPVHLSGIFCQRSMLSGWDCVHVPPIRGETAQVCSCLHRIPPVVNVGIMREIIEQSVSPLVEQIGPMCRSMAESMTTTLEAIQLRKAEATQ